MRHYSRGRSGLPCHPFCQASFFPSLFVDAMNWEVSQAIAPVLEQQIPYSCPLISIFMLSKIQTRLLIWANNSVARGHPGTSYTWWRWSHNMLADVHRVMSSCVQASIPRILPAGKFLLLPTAQWSWTHMVPLYRRPAINVLPVTGFLNTHTQTKKHTNLRHILLKKDFNSRFDCEVNAHFAQNIWLYQS